MRIPVLLFVCLLLAGTPGCGYRLGAAKPAIMQKVTTIAVETFKNKTFVPNIEVLMADATIKQFQQDGTYEIVPDNRADAILTCTLDNVVQTQARAVLSNVLATKQYTLRLIVKFELTDRITGAPIMAGNIAADTTFFTDDDLQIDQQQAIVSAIHKVAVDLVGQISEGF